MATQLTDRQQQVQDLLDKGKTPSEIAKALKISENAVYQQRARIRKARGSRTRTRTNARKSTGKRASRRGAKRPPRAGLLSPTGGNGGKSPSAPISTAPKVMTPLQSIRRAKSEIEGAVKEAEAQVATAERDLKHAQERVEKVRSSHGEELAKLEAAEAALSNAKPKPRKRSASRNGRGSARAARAAAQTAPQGEGQPAPTPPPQEPQEPAAAPQEPPQEPAPTPEAEPAGVADGGGEGFAQEDGFGEE